jgi:hypothetical protein
MAQRQYAFREIEELEQFGEELDENVIDAGDTMTDIRCDEFAYYSVQ